MHAGASLEDNEDEDDEDDEGWGDEMEEVD